MKLNKNQCNRRDETSEIWALTAETTQWNNGSVTLERRSSESSVDTDFELIQVDIRCRKTDWKNGVGVSDRSGETQQTDVIMVNSGVVIRMWNYTRDVGIDSIMVRIIRQNCTKSYLQVRRLFRLSTIKNKWMYWKYK